VSRVLLALALLAGPALADDAVWTWVDERGEEHYTNDKSAIPEKFRTKAKTTAGQDLAVVKAADGKPEPSLKSAPVLVAPASFVRVVLFESSTNSASKTLSRAGVLDKLVSDNPGLKLERLEFAKAVDRAEKLQVTQLPTVLFMDGETVLARSTGLVTLKELQAQLDKVQGQ